MSLKYSEQSYKIGNTAINFQTYCDVLIFVDSEVLQALKIQWNRDFFI